MRPLPWQYGRPTPPPNPDVLDGWFAPAPCCGRLVEWSQGYGQPSEPVEHDCQVAS